MSKAMDTLNTFNNLIRTLLAMVIVGGISVASWLGYSAVTAKEEKEVALEKAQSQLVEQERLLAEKESLLQANAAEINRLGEEVVLKEKEIQRLDTAMRLLKVDSRVAEIAVLEQEVNPDTEQVTTTIKFQELNTEGAPIGEPKIIELQGDMVYVEHWVVKFEDKFVEQRDLDRSTSIVLFRRIFGEYQKPVEGQALDPVGTAPTAYARGGKMSEFEKGIWDDFWNIAHDEDRAVELGIRAAHGDAVSTKLREGKRYRMFLRASGGLSITPLPEKNEPAPST